MKKRILFFLVLLPLLVFSQQKKTEYLIHKNAYYLDNSQDIDDFNQIYSYYKNGAFIKPIGNDIYDNIDKNKSKWLLIKLPKQLKEDSYFTIWHQYFKSVEVYQIKNDTVLKLHCIDNLQNFSHKAINFRLPTWKIEKGNNIELIIKIENSISLFTKKFLLLNENEFLEFVQKDGYFTIFLLTFFIILLLVNLLLFLDQKRWSFIAYGFFLIFTFLDLFAYKGLGVKYLWGDSLFLIVNLKTMFQLLGFSFLILFQLSFYGKKRIPKFFNGFLKFFIGINSLLLLLFLSKIYHSNFSNIKSISWVVLQLEIIFMIVFHVYLAFKNKIPKYLAVGFTIPLFFYQIRTLYNPEADISILTGLLLDNAQYIATALELVFITYFIISEILQEKRMASILKQENLALKNSFQDNLLQLQLKERNQLINAVHDSFGGNIEALKINLLGNIHQKKSEIEKIVNSFYKEYRFLLNTIFTPKINVENLIENLNDLCLKLNTLSKIDIQTHFHLNDTFLKQEDTYHIYLIFSELLTNGIKYSKASHILVRMVTENQFIILKYIDNGIGFDTTFIPKNGFGLHNIKERVALLNGTTKIESSKNNGVTITMKIPKNETNKNSNS
ncbi:hypothetical protein FDT66_03770 [Polaribacter aestuariivivens]|uniref:histidine kinase n=1 Tax=Polaribacter aestuariivivens TaxID=2304626 RepID=A0A5S3NDE9_9FLAO|nr:ATP-binding protein [Polaribacter aestuariivivens]TMM31096.1 hypothetical protein FDT66_03770 [Polaribacter aestuariivivens]